MQQPPSESERLAEEIEGQKLRAAFQADINQRAAQTSGTQKEAIPLLLEAYPLLRNWQRSFIDKASLYASRSDMKKRYSARQITAYAAAETLMPLLDMQPKEFHGLFVMCCLAAGTALPTKPKK
ncbi:hypothetical protein [Methylomicrobium sp. Wu6]|uniref:hypothetical protein n=1 Tax=Methylomicrobium sp. Wu6 TaxID=3107928 RepID=UPI002DD6652E|nr:hypothetical protein [Methylomicrobium sp. Wu6]MEC4747417.1 hypothetical protein [Methylomicrobium sp. Wu6]